MAKSITAAQRRKIQEDLTGRIRVRLEEEINYFDGCDGYFNTLQSSILEAVAGHLDEVIKGALHGWEVQFERDENARVVKLEAEVKELRKRNKELSAIEKLVNDAKNSVD